MMRPYKRIVLMHVAIIAGGVPIMMLGSPVPLLCILVFLKIGMDVTWESDTDITAMVNEGVRHAYLNPDNVLRASMVNDPLGTRTNTGDNTPAIIHMELVPGDKVEIKLAAKGGGSENKSRFTVLNPSGSLVDWVVETVPTLGAGWCPPGMLGIGVGGTAEKAMLLAKEALMEHIDIHELQARGPSNRREELRLEIYDKVNALGIGAQRQPCGLGNGDHDRLVAEDEVVGQDVTPTGAVAVDDARAGETPDFDLFLGIKPPGSFFAQKEQAN